MYLLFLIIFSNIFIICFSELPKIDQLVYINSSEYIVITPKQITFVNSPKPKFNLIFNSNRNIEGKFYQLSDIFSKYEYKPYQGKQIINSTIITGSKGRFVYKPINFNSQQIDLGIIDQVKLEIELVNNYRQNIKLSGKIILLPITGKFVSSDFVFNNDGWKIIGNNPLLTPIQEPIYCNRRYNNFSMFITGTDNYINIDNSNKYDKSIWYFKAPDKYNMDITMAYLGWIESVQIFISGDFSKLNNLELVPLVKIECKKLSYSVNYFFKTKLNSFENKFSIKLDEKYWNKLSNQFDGFNLLSKSEFIHCLENISSLEILGDWTVGFETIGFDSISIYKLK